MTKSKNCQLSWVIAVRILGTSRGVVWEESQRICHGHEKSLMVTKGEGGEEYKLGMGLIDAKYYI